MPDVRCPSLKVLTPMSNYNLGCGSRRPEFIYQQRTEPSRRIRRRVAGCCYRLIYTVNVGMRCEEPREAWTAPLNRSNRRWTCQPQRLDWLQIKKKNKKTHNPAMFLHFPVSSFLYITQITKACFSYYYFLFSCILFWNSGDVSCLDGSLMCMHDSPGRAKFAWPRYLTGARTAK